MIFRDWYSWMASDEKASTFEEEYCAFRINGLEHGT